MSNATEQKELIQQWLAVNPGTEQQAQFFLEANNWDLNAALSNFYEEPPLSEGLPPAHHQGDPALPPDPNLIPTGSDIHPPTAAPVVSAGSYDTESSVQQAASTSSASVPRRRHGSGARIATLSSLSGHDSEDTGKPEEWYAGGEHSGMAVMPRGQDSDEHGNDGARRGSLVDRILHRASETGAPGPGGFGEPAEAAAAKPKKRFAGRGHRLDSSSDDKQGASSDDDYTPSSDGDEGGQEADFGGGEGVAIRELTFWRNGFSIGGGPLHNIEDPVNRQNLEAILQGRAPLDVLNVHPGQQVEMRVTDRRSEDYILPPAPPVKPFSGTGHRLGDLAPSVTTGASTSSVQQAAGGATAPSENPITLDPSQPTVRVQIRLVDGSRLIANVNPSHTIGDLRRFVTAQRPDASQRPFAFNTVMPPAVLSDDSVTVADADIVNAVIVQHPL
ncbi:protein phosphatase regulator [Coemansia sp. RSA 1813]|nr:protein phosphatase regulator [Coemansia sp. RSA 1646]KAJ1767296.1 protein phosphatase regulator [Coemansia sp. RSA 1843]KAJ2089443.1 protein phosphatase regulator [Coemansia sp. RSA 986]KAJ2214921.1 protein phosphatase regulator [Coemansia sp. RSA 487]KAJ2563808.1 protein phosphatase regulator [Coemansia sp. RSA 1813]